MSCGLRVKNSEEHPDQMRRARHLGKSASFSDSDPRTFLCMLCIILNATVRGGLGTTVVEFTQPLRDKLALWSKLISTGAAAGSGSNLVAAPAPIKCNLAGGGRANVDVYYTNCTKWE